MSKDGVIRLDQLRRGSSTRPQTFSTFGLHARVRRTMLQEFTSNTYEVHDLNNISAEQKHLFSNTDSRPWKGQFNLISLVPSKYCTMDREREFYKEFIWFVKIRSERLYFDIE